MGINANGRLGAGYKREFTVLFTLPSHLPDNLQSEEYEVILEILLEPVECNPGLLF
ncbi:MAG: hypothetical protein IPP79_12670 [Chitinophagaceae bacterium]|nr:hypothetical protein [Chitinophagaceae bacterium]